MLDKKKMLEESAARMAELKVGIRSMTQAVETLSGGQRQCVAVARAAAFAPCRHHGRAHRRPGREGGQHELLELISAGCATRACP